MIIESVIVLSNQIILQSDYEEKTEPFKTYKYRQTEAPKLTLVNKNLYTNKNDISQFTSMNYKSFNNITLYLDMGTDGANILIINNIIEFLFPLNNHLF